MVKLIAKVLYLSLTFGLMASVLSACGNKGELFRVPEDLTLEDIERLQQSTLGSDVPENDESVSRPASEDESPEDSSDEAVSRNKNKVLNN